MRRDEKFARVLRAAKWVYVLTGLGLAILGAVRRSPYQIMLSLGTLLLFPLIYAVYRLFGWKKGPRLEFCIYAFTFLSFTLGGAANFYMLIPGFNKIAHTLSGTFVSMLALAMYMVLERARPMSKQSAVTAACFVFFASMAVAALFEIGEFALAPIVGRDLQRVQDSGVTDTITDMIVCMVGTLAFVPLVVRFYRGKRDPLTGAVDEFLRNNGIIQNCET